MHGIHRAINDGCVAACHDLSEGGLGVALAEMAFSGGLGLEVDLRKVPLADGINRNDVAFFSESNSRFLVEVAPTRCRDFESIMKDLPVAAIGAVIEHPTLLVHGLSGRKVVETALDTLKHAWQRPLSEKLD
jgi:phosphoribosylformylglycinamidine (FGAM) synthase-like enzyme